MSNPIISDSSLQSEALQQRISYLESILKANHIPFEPWPKESASILTEPKGSSPIGPVTITPGHARFFFSLFHGRSDVYSKRSVMKNGKAGYFPVCDNFWKYGVCPKAEHQKIRCVDCENRHWSAVTQRALMAHFIGNKQDGSDVIGIYPLLPDDTCRLLVFDFDDHETDTGDTWQGDVNALRTICRQSEVPVLTERSRSGHGAHVWMFFEEAIPAEMARKFASALLTKGAESVNVRDFKTYDRMIPAQEHLQPGGLGNLIALPLQGQALKQGNSAFVDEDWNAYPDQWAVLKSATRLSKAFIEEKIAAWCTNGELGSLSDMTSFEVNEKPWHKKPLDFCAEDVANPLQITYADGIYIPVAGVKPRLQNQLRRLAAFSNPEFYKNKALGFSTHNIPRIVFCGEDTGAYIHLPRGCSDALIEKLTQSEIPYQIQEERQSGHPIRVTFQGALYPQQAAAAEKMLQFDMGVLSAATAFGKTAVGAYLVAQRKVNTLVLVHTSEIMQNWVDDFAKFLKIDEDAPEYITPKGRHKRRKSAIGTLYGGHNTLTGILDIAMITSLGKRGDIAPLVKEYGMVLMDECHHAGASIAEEVLNDVSARFVYGLTATPKRDDGQDQKIFMQFGPIRYRYTAKERAAAQGIAHYVYPRFTRLFAAGGEKFTYNQAKRAVVQSDVRNKQILADVEECLRNGRTPLVLTKEKAHAAMFFRALQSKADHVFLLQGGSAAKQKEALRAQMKAVPTDESVVLVAIGQYIGEGFNFPRLDTMMLAMPISWQGNVEQYAGRLHRDYEGKREVILYDYVDSHLPVLESMYYKRLRTYKRIGYEIVSQPAGEKQQSNAIFEGADYLPVYEKDLQQAAKSIVVASPGLNRAKTRRLIQLVQECQAAGVTVSVITLPAESYPAARIEATANLQALLRNGGVYVTVQPGLHEKFAVIDQSIIWYGSANLLSRSKENDSIMRLENPEIASELLTTLTAI